MSDKASNTYSMTLDAPYVGLRPYNRNERQIFYGRERNAQFLIDKIFSAHLTLLYGKSGLGKSSLLNAMVIPGLEANSSTVLYFDQWAAESPVAALRAALVELADEHGVANAAAGAPTTIELVRLLCFQTNTTIVLILDQFEEFLVWHGDHIEPVKDELAVLLRSDLDVRVVISMREEYLAALEPFRHDFQNLFQSTYRLEPLDEAGIRTAIMRPLEHFDASCDSELVDTLLEDLKVQDDDNNDEIVNDTSIYGLELPILQLICSQLWEIVKEDHRRRLDLALYRSQGGDKGILSEYVKSVVPKGRFKQLITADMLRCLAPPSGLKMSFSIDDLANLSELHLKKETISKELRRLESNRILRTRKFHTGERFELLHDAFIDILTPWIKAIRERTARYKRWSAWSFAVLVMALTVGAVIQKKDADFWKTYARSTEQRLAESTANLNASRRHTTRVGKLIDDHKPATNPQITLGEIRKETEQFRQDVETADNRTQKVVKEEATSLGKPTLPPRFVMHVTRSAVKLSGELPNQALIDDTIKTMQDNFDEDLDVQSTLKIVENTATPDWLGSVIALAQKLKYTLPPATIKADKGELTISGTALTDKHRTEITALAQDAVADGWRVNNKLNALPDFELQHSGTKLMLSGTMPDSKSINRAVKMTRNTFGRLTTQNKLSADNTITHPDWLNPVFKLGNKLKNLDPPASIELTGQTLTITGTAQNENIRQQFVKHAKAVAAHGLMVNNQLKVLPDFVIKHNNAKHNNNSLVLSGVMPNQDSIDRAVKTAQQTFGKDQVQNELRIGNAVSHPDKLYDLFSLASELKQLNPPASIAIAGHELTITGTALNDGLRTKIDIHAQVAVGEDWQVNNQIEIPPVYEIKRNGEKLVLSGNMPNQASIDHVLKTAQQTFGYHHVQNDLRVGHAVTQPDKLYDMLALTSKLKQLGPNASIKVADRQFILTGTALNNKLRTKIANDAQVAMSQGWQVNNRLEVPPTFVMKRNGPELLLSGTMPDQTSIDQAVKTARETFGWLRVQNNLSVGDAITHPDWLSSVFALGKDLKQLDSHASLQITDRKLTLSGIALNTRLRNKIGINAQTLATLGLDINNRLAVPPTLVMKRSGAKLILSGSMPDQASIEHAVKTAQNTFGTHRVQNNLSVGTAVTHPGWLNDVTALSKKLKDLNAPASMQVANNELTLSGTAPNNALRIAVSKAAQAAVTDDWKINNQLIAHPDFVMEYNGTDVILRGTLPDHALIDRAVKMARNTFEKYAIRNELKVSNAVKHPDWLDKTLDFGLKMKNIVPPASIKITDRELTITGTALNDKLRAKIGIEARDTVQKNWRVKNQLNVPTLITFELDSHIITEDGKAELEKNYKALLATYDNIEVAGHTDSIGNASRNCALSQQRAEAVKSYLVGLGLDEKKLTTKGYSDTVPLDCNIDEEGHTPGNRRIEFYTSKGPDPATCMDGRVIALPNRLSSCR